MPPSTPAAPDDEDDGRPWLERLRSSQLLVEQSLEARLSTLARKQTLSCRLGTPLGQALEAMHQRGVGSIVVTDEHDGPRGILTRHDILGRVTLAQCPLAAPIDGVMSTPVHSLRSDQTLQDAALLMARRGIRHVPVVEDGRLVDIVSERDLFALQRLSLRQLSSEIRAAHDVPTLATCGAHIRRFARNLLRQGVHARQLTELISHLNDLLVERLVHLEAQAHGLDLGRACWLAFGSEGRSEQTIATDQDNGLVFDSDAPDTDRPRWLAFAQRVNAGLDACGYPLCKGGVMAGNPACCLSVQEWQQRFEHWMLHGAPADLLNASIYFDLRPLCGNTDLAQPLLALIRNEAARVPRFQKQMADNALQRRAPLNWRGALATTDSDGHELLDLKLQGTAIFVDAARLYALALGIAETNTRARLEAVARMQNAAAREADAWVGAFEYLQMLRLRVQLDEPPAAAPNALDVKTLNDIDHQVLKESIRVARRLQQRLELDYQR